MNALLENRVFFTSIHRPFQKALVSVKWVCSFVSENTDNNIAPSNFRNDFFFYIINKFHKYYKENDSVVLSEGVPSKETIEIVINYFKYNNRNNLSRIVIDRQTDVERKIYSTYKATTYYVNLAKDKLKFIDDSYVLTNNGLKLIEMKSSYFRLSKSEKKLLLCSLIANDFCVFVPMCLSLPYKNKYRIANHFHTSFIENVWGINIFKYTKASLEKNYDNVRLSWIEELGVITKTHRLSKQFIDAIESLEMTSQIESLNKELIKYIKESVIPNIKNDELMRKFIDIYKLLLHNGIDDVGYVNLYDIKSKLTISVEKYQEFLEYFYANERKERMILFTNVLTNIDKRKRFYIKNTPVIKIKIIL